MFLFKQSKEGGIMKTKNDVQKLFPCIIKEVQQVYDEWDENPDEYGGGGICHIIADKICELLNNNDIDSGIVSDPFENHVYSVLKVKDGIYNLDIPYRIYEIGSYYSFVKIPGVQFDINDLIMYQIDNNPNNFEDYIME